MRPARLTVAVRWGPRLSARCGTQVARPMTGELLDGGAVVGRLFLLYAPVEDPLST
jgi:hypothetical protein